MQQQQPRVNVPRRRLTQDEKFDALIESTAALQRQLARPRPRRFVDPKPEAFDGKRESVKSFIQRMELIFEEYEDHFHPENTLISYAVGYLGKHDAWYLGARENGTQPTTWEEFKNEFRSIFASGNEQEYAQTKIDNLKQTGAASKLLIEFNKYAASSGYNNTALQTKFLAALKPELKSQMAILSSNPEITLKVLQNTAVAVDNTLFTQKLYKSQSKDSEPRGNESWRGRGNRGRSRFGNGRGGSGNSGNQGRDNGNHQGKDSRSYVRKPLTAQEKQHRRDNGLCLYCGNGGHMAAQCPIAPTKTDPKDGVRLNKVSTRKTEKRSIRPRATITELSDNESEEPSSSEADEPTKTKPKKGTKIFQKRR